MNRSLSTICEAQMDRFAPKGTSVPGHSLLFATIILACWSWTAAQAQPIDLLERYPTTLTEGDTDPRRARAWDFSGEDIHELSQFSLDIGDRLSIRCGPSDLGIGHSTDGVVWAIVMPRTEGTLISSARGAGETIDHVWLRFHPSLLGEIFPTQTVSSPGDAVKLPRMRRIASLKMRGSWHASDRAMIPFPKSLTVDVDTKDGHRRFFDADRNAGTARYVSAFTNRAVPAAVSITKSLATESFDTLWEEYDRNYAMFAIRPDVDWTALRTEYRPKAIAAITAYEFATICAEMLAHLRDLHIWVTVDGEGVPVFNRPRQSNANPGAFVSIIPNARNTGRNILWGTTTDAIGVVRIDSWSDDSVPESFDFVLEGLRDTKALIVDVRINGGGSETLARQVAGRFLQETAVYSYSRYRNGPNHDELTDMLPRTAGPRGPWRYDRPVLLLIGELCMSSNESFIAMMAEAPNVTTMGDHTCGSSGNPKWVELPIGVRVSLPRWIDYLADDEPLDGRGVQPDIPYEPAEDAFKGKRDDLLTAALERLRANRSPN